MGARVRTIRKFQLIVVALSFSLMASAGTKFQTTTTLKAETSNNTSAADTFSTQSDGNNGTSNISKEPTRRLLYAGSTAKIYAHFMPWFGFTDHMNVGYASNDSLQVQKQVNDMVSRGLDGAIVDWYGPGGSNKHLLAYDQATQFIMQQAVQHPGFSFALMYDQGALNGCAATAGCDITQAMISDLNYANTTYWSSPAYLKFGGRPVVYFFVESTEAIDWTRVRNGVASNPVFVFRNSGGFTHAQSGGGFSWVAPETVSATDPMALKYLDNYYKTALGHRTMFSSGSAFKGFNDSLAAWGSNRIINQQCGQTWLKSMAENGKYYSATSQMLGIQIVTWNDYEEGSEIETGINNCVTVTASVSGTVVSWSITGQVNTIDHYSIFVSQDGENLMWLADTATSINSMNLAQFTLDAGNYIVYVQAVGKPSLTNKMSAGVQITVANQPPRAVLSVTPASGTLPVAVTASAAESSDVDGTIASTTITFGDGSAAVSGPSVTHSYNTAGTYTVKAVVTDNLGATASASQTVTISAAGGSNQPPVAALLLSAAAAYAPANISASTAGSSDTDGTIVGSAINFGDGSAAVAGPSAFHQYSVPGTYNVVATVTDNAGASSSTSRSITVKTPEVIVGSPAAGAQVSSPVHVTAAGFSGNTVTAMQIYLDGTLVYNVKAARIDTFVAAGAGAHNLAIKGWDSAGRSFFSALKISVGNASPVVVLDLSSASMLVGGSVSASSAGSSDPDGSIVASSIDFGDGTVVLGNSASHRYTVAGMYTLKATVTDNIGASSSMATIIHITPQYVTISSPTFISTTSTSVHVVGTAFSGYRITATQVYLDGVLKYQIAASTADTVLPLTRGTHRIAVKGWDSSGANFLTAVNVTRQ